WMDIGVLSVRNFGNLSRFKSFAWLALMLSSIPIHLFFNSTIFYVETQRSTFSMTLAAEPFVKGAKYYAPGGSLWNMNVPINCTHPANSTVTALCSSTIVAKEYQNIWNVSSVPYFCPVNGTYCVNATWSFNDGTSADSSIVYFDRMRSIGGFP